MAATNEDADVSVEVARIKAVADLVNAWAASLEEDGEALPNVLRGTLTGSMDAIISDAAAIQEKLRRVGNPPAAQ